MNVNTIEFLIKSMYCDVKSEFEHQQILFLSLKSNASGCNTNDFKHAIANYKKRNDIYGLFSYLDRMIDIKVEQNLKNKKHCNKTLFFDCKKITVEKLEPEDDFIYFLIAKFGLQKLIETHQLDYYKVQDFWEWCVREAKNSVSKKQSRKDGLFVQKGFFVEAALQPRNNEQSKLEMGKIKSLLKKQALD
jgi:hypothetical protein